MANALYTKGKQAILSDLDWTAATLKAVLLSSGYTPDLATDAFLADIPGGAIIATSGALTGASATGGVADADDVTFGSVSGADADFAVIYEDTGSGATSRLLACIDTATGLPVTPNGGDITVAWDNGANKIFKL